MPFNLRQCISLIFGFGMMVVLSFLHLLPWLAVLVSVIAYGAVFFLLPAKAPEVVAEISDDMTPEDVAKNLSVASGIIVRLREQADHVDEQTAEAIRNAAKTADRIVREIGKDHAKIQQARTFLTLHLPRTTALATACAQLTIAGGDLQRDVLERASEALKSAAKGFDQQFAALIAKDADQLAIASDSLTALLKIDYGQIALATSHSA